MAHLRSTNHCLIPLIAAALLCVGCAEPPSGLGVGDAKQLQKKGRPASAAPIALRGTSTLMIPFAVETSEWQGQGFYIGSISGTSLYGAGSSSAAGWDRGSSSEYFGGSDNLRWNNVAFYDPNTAKSRLLLDHPALICRFHAITDKGPVRGDYLLFGVADRDTNHDGIIGPDDAVRLYRTDLSGNAVLAITPADTQLLGVTSFDETWTYLRIRRDSDGDGKFTDRDLVDVLRADPRLWSDPQLWRGREPEKVIPDDLRARAFETATKSATQP